MGEIADMMLDGILDSNGEYTGYSYGHPVNADDDFYEGTPIEGTKKFTHDNEAYARNLKVRNLMKQKGIPKGRSQKKALKAYGAAFGTDRPTYHACHHWREFKAFMHGYGSMCKREDQ